MVWLVRVPDTPGTELRWVQVTATGGVHGEGSMSSFAAAWRASPVRAPVVALLPVSDALVTTVSAPVRNARQLQQALPFLIEENLATDIDLMQVVAGPVMAGGRLQVIAVMRERIARALAAFQAEGIDPDVLTIDALLLPLPASGALLYLNGAGSLLASTDGAVLGLHEEDAGVVLSTLSPAADGELEVRVASDASVLPARAFEAAPPPCCGRVSLDETPVDLLSLLASGKFSARLQRAANLRQGVFANTTGRTLDVGFDWHPLAWMAALWAVVALGYQLAVGIAHGRAADAVRSESVALYRQLFPGASQVPDPRRQMQGRISAVAGGGNAFARLVAEASAVVAELDGGTGRYTTRSLGWEQAQGQLRLDVVARSLEDVEQLRQRLEARGLRVEVGAGVSQDGGYRARINLSVGA